MDNNKIENKREFLINYYDIDSDSESSKSINSKQLTIYVHFLFKKKKIIKHIKI